MHRRLITTAVLTVGVMLSLACQEDAKNQKETAVPSQGISGTSFDAEEFSCKKKVKPRSAALFLADEPSWDNGIKALMQSKCLPCHAAGATPPDLSAHASTAETVEDNLERMQRTGAGVMPPAGQLPQKDIALFKAWLDAGTPESSGSTGTSDGTADQAADGESDATADEPGSDGDDEDEDEDDSAVDESEYDSKLCPNAARRHDAQNQN